MTFTAPDTIPQPPTEAPSNGKRPARPDRTAEAAQLAAALVEAENELTRDQTALDKAKAEVERLEDWVKFDRERIQSRTKSRDHFDRLQAKAAK